MVTRWRKSAVRTVVLAFVVSLTAALCADAQAPIAQPAPQPSAAAPGAAPVVDVSLARIRKQLRETPPSPAPSHSSLLKLEYYVQVVGTPPPIDFFKDFNIGLASSVQYGGMTHAEFIRVTAPFWRKW